MPKITKGEEPQTIVKKIRMTSCWPRKKRRSLNSSQKKKKQIKQGIEKKLEMVVKKEQTPNWAMVKQ